MKAFVARFLRALSPAASTLGVIGLGAIAAVLTQTTSPNSFAACKRDGETAAVLGIVRDHDPTDQAYALQGLCGGGDPLFVLAHGTEVPPTALLISLGHRASTDAGRPLLIEDHHWAIPLHWACSHEIAKTVAPHLPFGTAQAPWIGTAAALLFVIIVARKSARLLSAAFLVMTSLIAGITLARASVEHGLIAATMLPFATICAATIALTLTASRLSLEQV